MSIMYLNMYTLFKIINKNVNYVIIKYEKSFIFHYAIRSLIKKGDITGNIDFNVKIAIFVLKIGNIAVE